MNDNFAIQLFEGKKVRIVWDAGQEKYYFSVADIVQVLTDSVNPRDYIKKMLVTFLSGVWLSEKSSFHNDMLFYLFGKLIAIPATTCPKSFLGRALK